MLAVLSKRFLTTQFRNQIRTYLSSAYLCDEVWEQRKRTPIFQKIDYDDLYHQLDRTFLSGQRISVLDVDLFVNGVNAEFFQNEMEDVLFKVRNNPETKLFSERMMHAVIRYYIAIGKKKDLLPLLSNRLNYGIFPDYYLSNYLMDEFLKEGDTISASKIAVLQMLQEDFDHPIIKKMSLLSCFKYLNSPEIWVPPKEPDADPDDEEEDVRVRVTFLRNPYFDDHFDLLDTNHLLGKTLYISGESNASPLGLSSQLVGLSLYEKWASLQQLLKTISENKNEVHEEALNLVEEYVKARPKQSEDNKPQEDTTEVLELKKLVLTAVDRARKNVALLPGSLEQTAEEEVKAIIKEHESKDISTLQALYRTWEKEREDHIQYEIFESEKRKAAEEIAKTKEYLKTQEDRIFYFDNEDEWDLVVENKAERKDALEKKMSQRKKKVEEEEYIPPDVDARRG